MSYKNGLHSRRLSEIEAGKYQLFRSFGQFGTQGGTHEKVVPTWYP